MRREFKKKSKVLLIDDNYEHLAGIRELLNLEGTFDVVGIATNVTVGLNLIKKYQPDVVLHVSARISSVLRRMRHVRPERDEACKGGDYRAASSNVHTVEKRLP